MRWNENVADVEQAALEAFGEKIHLRGQSIVAIVSDDPYEASGDVPVQLRRMFVQIDTALAHRLQLVVDEPIEVRGQVGRIGAFAPDSNGKTRIEVTL